MFFFLIIYMKDSIPYEHTVNPRAVHTYAADKERCL